MFGLLTTSVAQTFAACTKPLFLGIFQPWYQYLNLNVVRTQDGSTVCQITNFNSGDATHIFGIHSPFLLIAMAILDDLIRVAALVAVGYVIYGGIQYIVSQGSPDATKRAQQTIINALIGVVVAALAAGIVAFLGNALGS